MLSICLKFPAIQAETRNFLKTSVLQGAHLFREFFLHTDILSDVNSPS